METRQRTKDFLMVKAKQFLALHPDVTKKLNRKQRRKVAMDMVKRVLTESRNDVSI